MSVLTLELPETLYGKLESQARSEGVSLTEHVLSLLSWEATSYRKEAVPLETVQQQRESFDKLISNRRSASEKEMEQFLAEREPSEKPSELPPEVLARVQQMIQEKRAQLG